MEVRPATNVLDNVTYVIEDDLLKRVIALDGEEGLRELRTLLLVPATLQQEMIRLHHDHNTAAHFGVRKTIKRLQMYYFWQGMNQQVVEYVKSCKPCQRNNVREVNNALPRPVIPRGPFDIVALDCLQLPTSVHGNVWVLVAVDYFTKYANTYVLKGNPSTANVLKCLTEYIGQHALVRLFRVDEGVEFTNLAFKDACDQLGIETSYAPTGHHRANGLVERINRTIQNSLCKVLDETVEYDYWEEYITWVTFAYNTSYHEGIQDTPFFMVYGRHAVLPADSWIFKKIIEGEEVPVDLEAYKKDMMIRFAHSYARARQHLQKQYDRMNLEADNQKQVAFEIGDEVWAYLPELQQDKDVKAIAKLTYQWMGPYRIAEKHPESKVLYLVLTERRVKNEQYIHVNRLRKYIARELRPTDQVLPVPTYDFVWDELPKNQGLNASEQMDLAIEDGQGSRRAAPEATEDPAVELVAHDRREPTIAEASLVGKVFVDGPDRFIVRMVRYHKRHKVMVAWYERLIKKQGQWIGTGRTEFSSVPEVQHWIQESASRLHQQGER